MAGERINDPDVVDSDDLLGPAERGRIERERSCVVVLAHGADPVRHAEGVSGRPKHFDTPEEAKQWGERNMLSFAVVRVTYTAEVLHTGRGTDR